jgi:hypothetical protein
MARFGIPRRASDMQVIEPAKAVNWRRGLIRIWLLLSAAWIMGWVVYLTIFAIQNGFQSSRDFLAIPVLLFGPPIALLLFGLAAGWAFRGFKPDDNDSTGADPRT